MRLKHKCLLIFSIGVFLLFLASAVYAADASFQQRLLNAFALPAEGLAGNHYLLRRVDAGTGEIRHLEFWLDFAGDRLLRREHFRDGGSETVFAGPRHGWRERAGSRHCLPDAERVQTLQSLRYHFFYLFTQSDLVLQA